ncbi:D-isomer specific 2-hydroxyacid dehydrogenase-like protein [Bacillus oleivorans]|uniref:D-isomer specific 2-hydroxyacid dehydrogenase-like protein n=1 Tax=Bacillus oleivorans TaxID=1448271 RepID=A0A285D4D4_9BACI|nr:NAD(P)-dependent oxidoreductase [Bacillus oleivorans]SNX74684.1 D-isomer specific 2-hydroxyacid dehydrogenase-like protein [Bacillus oleivorans]
MERILYFDHLPDDLKQIVLEKVQPGVTLTFWSDLSERQRELELRQTDYFILTAFKIDEKIIRLAEKLKFIQKVGIGVDNIDLVAAASRSVPVSNTPGGNSISVSEATILFILALYRRLIEMNQATKEGKWYSWNFRSSSYEIYGKTYGLIGMGNIGYETAKRSKAFGTNIVYYDKRRLSFEKEKEIHAQYVSLDQLLQVSDIISVHVPLLPETRV